jgi:glycosidase
MHWDAGPNAGFTTGTPWLPVHPDYAELNAAAQRADPRSVWSFYRDLLRLRRQTSALRRGAFERLSQPSKGGLAYLRTAPDQQALVGLNFRATPVRLAFQHPVDPSGWSMGLAAHPDRAASLMPEALELGAFQAAVFIRSG